MTWLAWRQFRMQAVVSAVLLLALAAFVLATAPHIAHIYVLDVKCTSGTIRHCNVKHLRLVQSLTRFLPAMNDVVTLTPVLIGMFWGAPLVAREIETGSIRFVFMQSVSRLRWLSTRLLVVGAGCIVAGGLASLMVTWWASPWDRFNNLPFGTYDVRGVVPMGYCLFAAALGALIGAVVRRTIPAMAITLLTFGLATTAFGEWVRPHLLGGELNSRYWTLQWIEFSIFLGLAVVLASATLWWIRHRLT